jgi:hypothetical protein
VAGFAAIEHPKRVLQMKKLFTGMQGTVEARVQETLDELTCNGLLSVVNARIQEEYLGNSFPRACEDGQGNSGCDTVKLQTHSETANPQ